MRTLEQESVAEEKGTQRFAEIKVAIIEDDRLFRELLVAEIGKVPGLRCVWSGERAEDALYDQGREVPDVMLMDLHLPGVQGTECIRLLKRLFPRMQFLAITNFDDPQLVFEAIRVGASGYIVKREPLARVMEAIGEVAHGGGPMSPHVARMVLQVLQEPSATAIEALTERECNVLDLARKGCRYAEIAAALGISKDTVRKHFNNIYQKLHVHSKAEAVAKMRWRSIGDRGGSEARG